MSDSIDAVEQKKQAEEIASLKTQTTGLQEGLSEVKTDIKDLKTEISADMKTLLQAVNANSQSSNNSNLSNVKTYGGWGLGALVGFMTLVILPMRESIDERRLEQDEKNKLQASNLKLAEVSIFAQAVSSAYTNGKQDGTIDCIKTQLNAVDDKGPRGSDK